MTHKERALAWLLDRFPSRWEAEDVESLASLLAYTQGERLPAFYVEHRTAQETSGSGYRPPELPWNHAGPFSSYGEAAAHWERIRPNWQEGRVVTRCPHCGEYSPAAAS